MAFMGPREDCLVLFLFSFFWQRSADCAKVRQLNTHLEIDKEVWHALCDALKIAVAEPCSVWIYLLGYSLMNLQHPKLSQPYRDHG